MRVEGLNHVNTIAADIGATVRFYEEVLGMEARPLPMAPAGFAGRWIHDVAGQPIIHVQAHDPARHGPLADAASTGRIDHVALTCTDFAGMLERCAAMGLEHKVNDRKYGDLRQIFVTDPDGMVLELNFPGD